MHELTPEQLNAPVPGTYGSILETMRHSVGGDTYYLSHLTADPAREIESSQMDLRELRVAMEADATDVETNCSLHTSIRTRS